MDKKSKIITSVSAIIATVAIAFSIYAFSEIESVNNQIRYSEEYAFSELISSISKLDTAIKKASLTTTGQYASTLYAEIWKESEIIKTNLSALSSEEIDTTTVQDFIATVGDYSLYLLRKTASGSELSDEEINNVKNLAKTTESLTIELSESKKAYNDQPSDTLLPDFETFKAVEVFGEESQIDQNFQAFATMVYDGPFSSHIDKLTPELTKNEQEITQEQAKTFVAEFLNTDASNVQFVQKVDTQIPFYNFTSTKEDDEISINITTQGGHVITFSNYREVGTITLTAEEAVLKAEQLLADNGFENFVKTYYTEFDNIVTINFAYEQDGVIMYPDLLKIEIFKDDGTLAGMEARGYIMSHKERTDITPTVTLDEATKIISSDLMVMSQNLAIIPTSGQNEVLVYEFKCCDQDDQNYILYVNAKTAQIENMLILIEDESGTLTM